MQERVAEAMAGEHVVIVLDLSDGTPAPLRALSCELAAATLLGRAAGAGGGGARDSALVVIAGTPDASNALYEPEPGAGAGEVCE